MTSAHFHAVTAHLLVLGFAIGLFALGLACWLRSREAKRVALVVIGMSAAMVLPIYWAGKQGYGAIRGLADEQGQAWLDLHMERGELVLWLYLLLAAVCAGALLANWRGWRYEGRWVAFTAGLALLTLAAGGWVAQAGGRVRHPEFRPAEPLALEEEEAYEVE